MKGLAGRRGRGLPKGARLDCVDNTGAKIVEIIAVRNWHGTHRRYPRAGIADRESGRPAPSITENAS